MYIGGFCRGYFCNKSLNYTFFSKSTDSFLDYSTLPVCLKRCNIFYNLLLIRLKNWKYNENGIRAQNSAFIVAWARNVRAQSAHITTEDDRPDDIVSEGPLLCIEWNSEGIEQRLNENNTHTKDSLVNGMLSLCSLYASFGQH